MPASCVVYIVRQLPVVDALHSASAADARSFITVDATDVLLVVVLDSVLVLELVVEMGVEDEDNVLELLSVLVLVLAVPLLVKKYPPRAATTSATTITAPAMVFEIPLLERRTSGNLTFSALAELINCF